MPLQLQDAGFIDGKAIANIFVSAFFDDPFRKSLYPGMSFDKQAAVVFSRRSNEYGNISAHYKIVVDTDSGEIVSYSSGNLSLWMRGFSQKTKRSGLSFLP